MILLIFGLLVAMPFTMLVGYLAWKRFTVHGNISTLLATRRMYNYSYYEDWMDISAAEGAVGKARDRLVKMGSKALPGLRTKYQRLNSEYNKLETDIICGPWDFAHLQKQLSEEQLRVIGDQRNIIDTMIGIVERKIGRAVNKDGEVDDGIA